MNRLKKIKYIKAEFFSDLPKVRKNEMLIVPKDNRLWECGPYTNNNHKPEWWMRQDKTAGSIRRCHGTTDFISHGITLPMWTNVDVRPNPNHTDFEIRVDQMPFAEPNSPSAFDIQGFPATSTKECPFSSGRVINGYYPKLVTPWEIKTAPGYSTLVLPTILEPNPNYTVMPGLIHTDYYHTINIVLVINTDQPFKIDIGTPMYQLIPIKRSDNITKILEGNESMHRFLHARGTGENYITNNDRRRSYRKLQKKADIEFETIENQSFIRKIINGK